MLFSSHKKQAGAWTSTQKARFPLQAQARRPSESHFHPGRQLAVTARMRAQVVSQVVGRPRPEPGSVRGFFFPLSPSARS